MKNIAKVLVLDPAMKQRVGHHHMWNSMLQKEFLRREIPTHFFFSNTIDAAALRQYQNAEPLFIYDAHRPVPETSGAEAVRAFVTHACYMFRDLAPLTERVTADTLIFGHTVTATSMMGIALWYASIPARQRPYVVLNVHFLWNPATANTSRDFTLAAENFRGSPRVRLFGVPDSLVILLQKATGFAAKQLPMPFALAPAAPTAPQNEHGKPDEAAGRGELVFGIAGGSVGIKNLDILPAAIERYLAEGGKGNFLLQLAPLDRRLTPILERLEQLAARYPERCVFMAELLEGNDFLAFIRKFSVALAPFDPLAYHSYRPSQFFQEVTSLGIPSIVCAGGFQQAEAERLDNGSIVMPTATPENLCQAMHTAEKNTHDLLCKARAAGKRYADFNNIDNFMQTIMAVEK